MVTRAKLVTPRFVALYCALAVMLVVQACSNGETASRVEGADSTAHTHAPPTTHGDAATMIAPSTTMLGHIPDPNAFDAVDSVFRNRVESAGLSGGVLYVVRDGVVIYEEAVGSVDRNTPMPVASAAKWLTSAVLMTLVDDGVLELDEPISQHLPEFTGPAAAVTLRQLLNHTSGIRQQSCIWNSGGSMSSCVAQLAAGTLEFEPGTAFSYGNAGYHVAGYLAQVVTGSDFKTLFFERIGRPLAMSSTSWGDGANPSPAAGVSTTADDYGHFLEMMLADGVYAGQRILSVASVAEIQANQVAGYDTRNDFAVRITKIPTYGLGLWRDVVDGEDRSVVVSGNGARGFYPWIDHANDAYGVLAVDDQRGAEVAVPASAAVVVAALEATPRA